MRRHAGLDCHLILRSARRCVDRLPHPATWQHGARCPGVCAPAEPSSPLRRYAGLDCHLILRNARHFVDEDPGLTGNLLVERLVGCHVHQCSKEEYVRVGSVVNSVPLSLSLSHSLSLSLSLCPRPRHHQLRACMFQLGSSAAALHV